ncbi:hypothetical protein EDEG_05080 [Edhazardia aedis USNM 41457]|uniref:Uncharacterized protein n=1 Tax=Edhazardia aedis (strain USNM 41457) TaxID=1003232 RepID=A0A0L1P6H9_EDHAE|nr:hypothetical protein EDEG_05080 [Edhazardia aedis USNM 41457]|eukprot:KNH48536.1 hypothetical protein EDEG_05080 [Edhazardia aedis USNM 41457]
MSDFSHNINKSQFYTQENIELQDTIDKINEPLMYIINDMKEVDTNETVHSENSNKHSHFDQDEKKLDCNILFDIIMWLTCNIVVGYFFIT